MSKHAARFIKPNDRLTLSNASKSTTGNIGGGSCRAWPRIFPGLQAILGNRRFESLCKA